MLSNRYDAVSRQAVKGPEETLLGMWRATWTSRRVLNHYEIMYALGEVSFSGKQARGLGEEMIEAAGEVVG